MILYIKNIISLINFFFLSMFFGKKNEEENKSILFFNSEKIGDLMVSSMILENDEIFPANVKVYFLIKKHYQALLKYYEGNIKIINYDYRMYKWFLPYRFKFINYLRSLKLNEFYNLTPARGMLNDEISLLSGANKIYATDSDKKYLNGIAGKITGKRYDEILFKEKKNEYVKQKEIIKRYFQDENKIKVKNEKTFRLSDSNYLINNSLSEKNKYIIISPLSTDLDRTWGMKNFSRLSNELSKRHDVILTGSSKEKILLEKIRKGNNKIIIDSSAMSDLPDIINYCRLFIGGDSGLTHIALKLGKPLLAILDGGYFNRYFPYDTEDKNNNYIYNMMDCFECGFNCIYDKKYCLLNIKYEDVLNKVNELLKN